MKEEGRGYIIDNELLYRAIAFFYISARTGVLSKKVTDKLALELYYTVPILKEALEKLKHKTSVAVLDSVNTPENIEVFPKVHRHVGCLTHAPFKDHRGNRC